MKSFPFVFCILVAKTVSASAVCIAGQTYRTTISAIFECIKNLVLGWVWRDRNGVLWGNPIGNFTNIPLKPDASGVIIDSPATEACAQIGAALPSFDDVNKMFSEFEQNSNGLTFNGGTDLQIVFPELKNTWFWTAANFFGSAQQALQFGEGDGGATGNIGNRSQNAPVLCVVH